MRVAQASQTGDFLAKMRPESLPCGSFIPSVIPIGGNSHKDDAIYRDCYLR